MSLLRSKLGSTCAILAPLTLALNPRLPIPIRGLRGEARFPIQPRLRNRLYVEEEKPLPKQKFLKRVFPNGLEDEEGLEFEESEQSEEHLQQPRMRILDDMPPDDHKLLLFREDVTQLRKFYMMDSEKHRYTVFMIYNVDDKNLSFMRDRMQKIGVLELGLDKFRAFAYHIQPRQYGRPYPRIHRGEDGEIPPYVDERIVHLQEEYDAEEQVIWHPTHRNVSYMGPNKGDWVRRVMDYLRFRRVS